MNLSYVAGRIYVLEDIMMAEGLSIFLGFTEKPSSSQMLTMVYV